MACFFIYFSFLILLFFLPSLDCSCPNHLPCADLEIQSPFSPYIKDSNDSDCTAPYKIYCEGSTPTITITNHDINHTLGVKDISYLDNTLTLLGQEYIDYVHGSHCSFLFNFSKPIHHFYFSLPYQFQSSNHSFFDCMWKDDEIPRRISDGTYHSTLGKDFNIYYRNESQNQVYPPNCSAHNQAPLLEWRLSFSKEEEEGDDGFSLLYVGFSHYLELRPDCFNQRVILENKTDKGKNIAIGASAAGAGLIALFFLGLFLYKRKRGQQHSTSSTLLYRSTSSELSSKKDPELGNISGIDYQTHIFSYDELHEATNAFDASKELGDGGFGTVYKGKLRDGRIVAVKRLYESNYKRVEQFMNEVVILSRLRHQNLVTLYGCTSRHSRELLLVYEFVPKGTVADHLHGSRTSEGGLTWPVRMSIAIETADALAYLHAVEPPIIHRDVKTNNILLDNSFHVKVADFGLSRLFPLDATHVSTAPQGTPGYVDPEYHQCYQLTDKSDVYSFGVVLMELISSMPAVDITRHRHEINLATMAMNKIQNQELDKFVDLELGYHSDVEVKRMITQVAELAFRCLQMDREMRPNIKEVLEGLRGIEIGDAPKPEKLGDADIPAKEESRLLKNFPPYSPDSVADRWGSMSTTPNTSG